MNKKCFASDENNSNLRKDQIEELRKRLLCFVDREYDSLKNTSFKESIEILHGISSMDTSERIENNLVYTWGHSFENYYFNSELLDEIFQINIKTPAIEKRKEISAIFKKIFDQILLIASSIDFFYLIYINPALLDASLERNYDARSLFYPSLNDLEMIRHDNGSLSIKLKNEFWINKSEDKSKQNIASVL